MLYDPKWEPRTKANPLALSTMIAWLEKQPRKKIYYYANARNCLLAQYFTAAGLRDVNVLPGFFGEGAWQRRRLPKGFEFIAAGTSGSPQDYTFGRALKRARQVANGYNPPW